MSARTAARHWGEAAVLAVLREKYPPPAYAVLDHVRSNTAYSSSDRTIDAVIMGLWPSRGVELWGMEIKSDRRDWQRELKDPAKAERMFRFFDRFFLVTGHADVATDAEIPAPWGWMVVNAKGNLITKKPAPANADVVPPSRAFLASLLRNVDTRIDDGQRKRAFEAGYAKGKAIQADTRRLTDLDKQHQELTQRVRTFEEASGLSIQYGHDIQNIARAVRFLTNGAELWRVRMEVERAAQQADRSAAMLRETLAQLPHDADRSAALLFALEQQISA